MRQAAKTDLSGFPPTSIEQRAVMHSITGRKVWQVGQEFTMGTFPIIVQIINNLRMNSRFLHAIRTKLTGLVDNYPIIIL